MSRRGIYKYYSTFGIHCKRNGIGLHVKVIPEKLHQQEIQLKQMMSRAERCAKMFLPFGLLSFLKKCKELCDSDENYISTPKYNKDSVTNTTQSQYATIWSSVATSCNYVSPSHVDDDCFICCLMVSYTSKIKKETNDHYQYNMPIALYFNFPNQGIAVGLRPGDIFF